MSHGKHIHKRLTDRQGRFRLAGIPPGRWTVKTVEDGLPLHHELATQEFIVEVQPGEAAEVEFKVIPKVRQMKMRAPLQMSAK